MPLYEYTCQSCHTRSELLIRGQQEPVCPKCGSSELNKEFSTFAPQGDGISPAAGGSHSHGSGCGCCQGPQGPCAMN